MKHVSTIFKSFFLVFIFGLSFISCKKGDDVTANTGGSIPSNGWTLGANTYSTVFFLRNGGGSNTLAAFDALPNAASFNRAMVLFNNITGIAAGTFKIVTKPNQSDLLADEMMVAPATGVSSNGSTTSYTAVTGQTVTATVTITGGKAKVVIPSVNVVSVPINASSITTTFSGTIVEP